MVWQQAQILPTWSQDTVGEHISERIAEVLILDRQTPTKRMANMVTQRGDVLQQSAVASFKTHTFHCGPYVSTQAV